MTVLNGD